MPGCQELSTDAALRAVCFEAAFDRVEEAQCRPAIEDTVVEGDLQVHHAPDGYGAVHDDRPPDNRRGLQDGRRRVVRDRRGGNAPQSAGVVDREGAAGDVVWRERFVPRLPDDLVYPAGEADDVQLVGAMDDGDDQGSLLEVDRHPYVYLPAKHDPVPVPHRVESRVLLEALHGGLDDEGQVGEPHPLTLGERRLLPIAQRSETRHVHLDQRPGVRYLRLAEGHAVRYGTPDARELDYLVALVDGYAPGWSFGLRWCLRRGGRGPALLDVALDVLLGYPAPRARAGDLGEVDVVLGGEPADDRGGTLQAERLGVLHRRAPVARAAARLGDHALLLAAIGGGRLRLGVGYGPLLGGRLGGGVLAGRGLRGGGLFLPLERDERDLGPHVDGGFFRDQEPLYPSGERRGELGVDLVGVDLGEGLVLLDLVPLGLEPARYRPLRHALPQLGHRHRCRHYLSPLVTGQLEHRRLYLLGRRYEE